jgi:hypothetical protein
LQVQGRSTPAVEGCFRFGHVNPPEKAGYIVQHSHTSIY